jgi:hypothetical protein
VPSETPGRRVLVPVANPASLQPLLAQAALLAAADDGCVELVTVLAPRAPSRDRSRAERGLDEAIETARHLDIRAAGRVIEAPQIADGVLAAIDEIGASLVLMGWRGGSSNTNVFGELIDLVVGRSSVPLAIVRFGSRPIRRVLLPVSADHLLPGGDRGLSLATRLAERLATGVPEPTTVLRTGPREVELPADVARLGDRIHHDPRRTDQAVAAFARPDDLVVAAVAPTVSGLRAATTHLAWAAPDATLLVAIDVGPTREEGLGDAVGAAGSPGPRRAADTSRGIRIVVTVRLPDGIGTTPDHLDRVLRTAGTTEHLMAWWPAGDPRPHVRATVTVTAEGVNAAISRVMVAVHEAPDLRGAEISYDVDRALADGGIAVREGDLGVVETAWTEVVPTPSSEERR